MVDLNTDCSVSTKNDTSKQRTVNTYLKMKLKLMKLKRASFEVNFIFCYIYIEMALLDADFPLTEIKYHFVIVFIIYKIKIERNKWCDHFILSFCSVIKLNCNGKHIA